MIVGGGRSGSGGGLCSLILCVLAALGANHCDASVGDFEQTPSSANAPVSAKDATARIKVPEGFKVSQFAAEPDVVQPIAMTIDHKGRLWVVENYAYPVWLGGPTGRDRILISKMPTGTAGSIDGRSSSIAARTSPGSSWALAACGCARRRTCFSFRTKMETIVRMGRR